MSADTIPAPSSSYDGSAPQARQFQGGLIALPVWPLWFLLGGYPILWVVGLAGFAPQLAAVPMLGYLLTARHVRIPRVYNIWFLFLIWVLASAVEVKGGSRLIGFGWRLSLYVAATIVFLYIFNCARTALPPKRLAWMMIAFLGFVVVGGYLGIAAPHRSLTTPFETVLPASITSNDLVSKLVHPPFAQISTSIYSKTPPRPSAPFPYTNIWGANFALLVPFVVVALTQSRNLGTRVLLVALLAVALVPALLTFNRGMVLALAVGMLYVAGRFALRGHTKALVAVIVLVGVGLTLMSLLHFGQRLNERVSNSQSNTTRTTLYKETLDGTMQSPLLGHGAPEHTTTSGGPQLALGSQGQLWTVLYSQGFVGAALFVTALIGLAWRSREGPTVPLMWMHVVVVMAVVMLPVYSLQSTELVVVMAAAAICLRDRPVRTDRQSWPRTAPAVPGAPTW